MDPKKLIKGLDMLHEAIHSEQTLLNPGELVSHIALVQVGLLLLNVAEAIPGMTVSMAVTGILLKLKLPTNRDEARAALTERVQLLEEEFDAFFASEDCAGDGEEGED